MVVSHFWKREVGPSPGQYHPLGTYSTPSVYPLVQVILTGKVEGLCLDPDQTSHIMFILESALILLSGPDSINIKSDPKKGRKSWFRLLL